MRVEVERLANATKRSRSFIVQEAVTNYVRDHADYLNELDHAVASARSGVGHSSEEVFGWMNSWGREDEKPKPKADIDVFHQS